LRALSDLIGFAPFNGLVIASSPIPDSTFFEHNGHPSRCFAQCLLLTADAQADASDLHGCLAKWEDKPNACQYKLEFVLSIWVFAKYPLSLFA
jgi:hypothetical protein